MSSREGGSSLADFKVEAVRLVKERGVAVAQAARDLDVHANLFGWGCGR
jgi:transposase-like protein